MITARKQRPRAFREIKKFPHADNADTIENVDADRRESETPPVANWVEHAGKPNGIGSAGEKSVTDQTAPFFVFITGERRCGGSAARIPSSAMAEKEVSVRELVEPIVSGSPTQRVRSSLRLH
jgi:hypothetical protein